MVTPLPPDMVNEQLDRAQEKLATAISHLESVVKERICLSKRVERELSQTRKSHEQKSEEWRKTLVAERKQHDHSMTDIKQRYDTLSEAYLALLEEAEDVRNRVKSLVRAAPATQE